MTPTPIPADPLTLCLGNLTAPRSRWRSAWERDVASVATRTDNTGSLNLLAFEANTFDGAVTIGHARSHAAIAVTVERFDQHLRSTIATRDAIGQAASMIMERLSSALTAPSTSAKASPEQQYSRNYRNRVARRELRRPLATSRRNAEAATDTCGVDMAV
jgi:hypothetical protein